MKKRIFSRLMAMAMALSLLSTSAFAASFSALQDAIDGGTTNDTEDNKIDGGYYGYAKREDNTYGITAKTNEDGTREVNLHEDVVAAEGDKTDQAAVTIKKGQDVTINMNGNTIDGKHVERDSALIRVDHAKLTVNGGNSSEDSGIKGTITGGNSNARKDAGGAFCIGDSTVTLNDIALTDNESTSDGGAIRIGSDNWSRPEKGLSGVTLNRVVIDGNTSKGEGADGGAISMFGCELKLVDTSITNNMCWDEGGGIWAGNSTTVTFEGNSHVFGNYSLNTATQEKVPNDLTIIKSKFYGEMKNEPSLNIKYVGEGVYKKHQAETKDKTDIAWTCEHIHRQPANCVAPETCTDCGAELGPIAVDNHIPGAPVEENRVEPQVGAPGSYDVVVYCSMCDKELSRETITIPALPMPIDFGDGLGGADTGTAIEDEATPLAGLFTRADVIGYLWEQSGSPEEELSTFADVPEDHYWAVAIGWAEDNGIALPDEEGNFRPDDLVLRTSDEPEGELQEFLNRYAVFAGVELEPDELFFVLDGAADDIIMGEDAQVIFDAFFAKLEKTLTEQKKAA